MQFHLERTLEAQYAAGAKKAWIKDAFYPSGHNMGTAKMGVDPKTSVVNGYGRTHDVPNLYIVDGSVFTTSTGVNPTATICAIAKRTAAHIAEEAKVRTKEVA
jgi:choline dehydrogenase-like flavoprotein